MRYSAGGFVTIAVVVALSGTAEVARAQRIGNHTAVFDARGVLKPWTSWRDALDREMAWYAKCPVEHGYPRFVMTTFMDGGYRMVDEHRGFIPAMQNGMGIISYLKYFAYTGKGNPALVAVARAMGDYLVKESLTPNNGKYPQFTRSTGRPWQLAQAPDCGSQCDRPYEIEPDKGGIAGYALVLLYEETKDDVSLKQALRNARNLVANMRPGDAKRSPWPMRVDFRTGEARGDVSADSAYILCLFDRLTDHGFGEFKAPRESLWRWIKDYQIPSVRNDGALWAQFFEDDDELANRNAWSPLNLARYLMEGRERLDPQWLEDAGSLIEFVSRTFTTMYDSVPVCSEQDDDHKPWGGVDSTWGAVLAMYAKATGRMQYALAAREALNYAIYATNDDGCPGEAAFKTARGGWQEDAHTDKIHNFVDAMTVFPGWAAAR